MLGMAFGTDVVWIDNAADGGNGCPSAFGDDFKGGDCPFAASGIKNDVDDPTEVGAMGGTAAADARRPILPPI
jgi:hypothetical protein